MAGRASGGSPMVVRESSVQRWWDSAPIGVVEKAFRQLPDCKDRSSLCRTERRVRPLCRLPWHLYDCGLQTQGGRLTGLNHEPYRLVWSPDSSILAASSFANNPAHRHETPVRLWHARTGEHLLDLPHAVMVDAIAWTDDGRRIATGSRDRTVRVWDSSSGEMLEQHGALPSIVMALQWTPDGSTLMARLHACPAVYLVRAGTATPVRCVEDDVDRVDIARLSPDGSRFITVSYRVATVVRVWDLATRQLLYQRGHAGTAGIINAGFLRDGSIYSSSRTAYQAGNDAMMTQHVYFDAPGIDRAALPNPVWQTRVLWYSRQNKIKLVSGAFDSIAIDDDNVVEGMHWSPNGRMFLVHLRNKARTNWFVEVIDDQGRRFMRIDATGSGDARWSPDSALIAVEDRTSNDIRVVDVRHRAPELYE